MVPNKKLFLCEKKSLQFIWSNFNMHEIQYLSKKDMQCIGKRLAIGNCFMVGGSTQRGFSLHIWKYLPHIEDDFINWRDLSLFAWELSHINFFLKNWYFMLGKACPNFFCLGLQGYDCQIRGGYGGLGLLLTLILGVNQCWTVLIFFKEWSGLVLTRTLENWASFWNVISF
jgi:hypothetical protein